MYPGSITTESMLQLCYSLRLHREYCKVKTSFFSTGLVLDQRKRRVSICIQYSAVSIYIQYSAVFVFLSVFRPLGKNYSLLFDYKQVPYDSPFTFRINFPRS